MAQVLLLSNCPYSASPAWVPLTPPVWRAAWCAFFVEGLRKSAPAALKHLAVPSRRFALLEHFCVSPVIE